MVASATWRLTKVWLGVTGTWSDRLTATLRGRFIGDRRDGRHQPRGHSGLLRDYFDTTLVWRSRRFEGLGLSLSCYNLLDTTYFHPGVRSGDAGTTPGAFDAMGVWKGSGGYDSSLLVQPGRAVLISLILGF